MKHAPDSVPGWACQAIWLVCAGWRDGTSKNRRFKLKRITSKKKMRAKLKSLKTEMSRRRHHPIPDQGRWLASVLSGHYRYYAVPDNSHALQAFRERVIGHWRQALSRRSQKGHMTWEQINRYAQAWLPQPRILHPWPDARFDARSKPKGGAQ